MANDLRSRRLRLPGYSKSSAHSKESGYKFLASQIWDFVAAGALACAIDASNFPHMANLSRTLKGAATSLCIPLPLGERDSG